MNLLQKQQVFTVLVSRLLARLHDMGYGVTFGETLRPPEMANLYAKEGKGIVNSLHCIKLAIDLNLFIDGSWLRRTDEYKEAGLVWESFSTSEYKCCWGGRFGDGDHFSLEHNGVK